MKFRVDDKAVYASTGGRDPKNGQAWLVFIHGAGQSHLTWSQQARAFAYDNYNVLALDLPGHGGSAGPALTSVGDMASWVVRVMDALRLEQVHLVNHSMGGLISLEIAARHGSRVKSVCFIATAMTIMVGAPLIEWSQSDPVRAFGFMTGLGHGAYGHVHDGSVPGVSLIGSGLDIMAQNDDDALHADLVSCLEYEGGADAAVQVQCPCVTIVADDDKMVAPRFGRSLHDALGQSELHILAKTGHMIPAERPREINQILREFLKTV